MAPVVSHSRRESCAQCVEHAQRHAGNWLGLGRDNAPREQCEDHARNGCPGINRR